MIHYGDITKLNGYELPVVDVITGGSPCQDLSVAGKRAGLAGERSGLAGERSGLFMEQMRIVKEMREHDRLSGRTGFLVRPRYMVWENVPGAFSSGNPKGADFAAVIEEIIKVAEPGAAVCVRVPDGGWTKSGCYYADDGSWSIAWRVHDAQFWGVPQRRKRIALVADFGGLSATEILFERNGLRRDTAESRAQGEGTAGGAEGGVASTITAAYGTKWNGNAGAFSGGNFVIDNGKFGIGNGNGAKVLCLNANSGGGQKRDAVLAFAQNQRDEVRDLSEARGNSVPAVFEQHSQDSRYNPHGDTCETVSAKYGTGGDNQPLVVEALPFDTTQVTSDKNWSNPKQGDPCHPLAAGAHPPAAVITFDKEMYNAGEKMTGEMQARYDNVAPTVRADSHPSGVCTSVVRRLTPMECERLQGYPDGWTDIGDWTDSKGKKRKAADGPRYKALGNSIALPFWQFLARRICAQYERDITLGSLFDGIGGFPFVFERCGAKAVWASEIEEFAIAVTKKRFPENTETGE